MFDLFGDGDRGFFGDAFDLDHDGHLDHMERAADFGLFMEMMKETDSYDGESDDDYDDDEY